MLNYERDCGRDSKPEYGAQVLSRTAMTVRAHRNSYDRGPGNFKRWSNCRYAVFNPRFAGDRK